MRRGGLRRFDANMDFVTFRDSKADIWAYATDKFIRIVNPMTATRKERAKPTDYWKVYQECTSLFGERRGVLPYKNLNPNWRQLLAQAVGCLGSAFARLAVDVGDVEAVTRVQAHGEAGERVGIERLAVHSRLVLAPDVGGDAPHAERVGPKRVLRFRAGPPDVRLGHEAHPRLGVRSDLEVLGTDVHRVRLKLRRSPQRPVRDTVTACRACGESLQVEARRGPERRVGPEVGLGGGS